MVLGLVQERICDPTEVLIARNLGSLEGADRQVADLVLASKSPTVLLAPVELLGDPLNHVLARDGLQRVELHLLAEIPSESARHHVTVSAHRHENVHAGTFCLRELGAYQVLKFG